MAATFGLDFGTTNSLVAFVAPDPETKEPAPRMLLEAGKPHPSVVWYPGAAPVAGRRAKEQLKELGLGVFGDVVRSPKMYLGSPTGLYVGGVTRQAVDVVADLLRFLREDALSRGLRGNPFESAVVSIPVGMRGPARAELRQAAQHAGINVHQFVHEPLAALYGYLRSQASFRQAVSALERRLVLVFDWGGGTLDLTLCQVRNGALLQVFNSGDDKVGGDQFDLRLQRLVRDKHEARHPGVDWLRIQPSADARILEACEDAKIALSSRGRRALVVPDILATAGPEKDLRMEITRDELEGITRDLITRGLSRIGELLDIPRVSKGGIEFCLATGGMVSMPAVQEGLREIFGLNRLRLVEDAATLIAQGTAWIAYDGVELELSKPLELLHADNTYVEVIPAGTHLPVRGSAVQHHIDMYCVDPSDGFAKFLFARPEWPGHAARGDSRTPYAHLTLPVDPHSRPLLERLEVEVTIDPDLIATVRATSKMREEGRLVPIHDLEFGLSVTSMMGSEGAKKGGTKHHA
ncbi:MAG TPA: Hsp70 family protein [Bryobacteraceae bacterium]|nr:Hsp70 family protein [Bryobacteraceae bacterium]